MLISKAGIDLIKQYEGLKLKAYICPAGILTIGYGSTGPHVKKDMVITQAEADRLLLKDLERFEKNVMNVVKVSMTQGMFDALCSFSFNVGNAALTGSTLLKKLNAGDKQGAADAFKNWTFGGGKQLPGLIKRREAERSLFLA